MDRRTPTDATFLRYDHWLRVFAAIVFVILGTGWGRCLAQETAALRVEDVVLETAQGKVTIKAEVADTPQLRQRGLMFRKHLAPDAGMLFDFGKPRPVHMWMKNTYVSLDMIFIRSDGRIIDIGANTVPLSETVVGVEEPVKGVLEVPAGTTARLGLKPGDRVLHPIFGNVRG